MKKLLLFLVRSYQKVISPLFPPSCRYYPTCSNYSLQAIEKHGAVKGGVMGMARIIRCNPFVRGGVDKVPDYFTVRRNPADQFALGFVNSESRSEKDKEEMKDEIDFLYEEYEEELLVRSDRPLASQAVKELVHVEEKDINLLSEKYFERVKATVLSLTGQKVESSNNLKFKFYEVQRDELSEEYFTHIHGNELNHGLDDEDNQKIGILVEEDYGIYEASSPELAIDAQLNMGVTEKDIDEKNENLLQYLYLLETIYE